MFKENLAKLLQSIEENSNVDIEEIQELLVDTPDDEIRSSFKQFSSLCHALTEALVKTHRSVSGIHLLKTAILKLQTHQAQLTPIHSDFCLLCIDSKCLNPALPFLEIDYTEIKKIDDKDEDVMRVMLFYYYGGLIYAAVKNFEQTSFFFEQVLTFPANVMNPLMLETYKKQLIITLLMNGKLPENMFPKYTSPCVLRQKKQVGHPYIQLAHEYTSLNYDEVRRIVTNNSNTYERDDNMGLVKQCLTQVHKRNIKCLTRTFLTLPLREVANHIGLASEKEAELHILNMIDDREIFATINQKEGMVVFHDNPEKYCSVDVFKKLQDDIAKSMSLINILRQLEMASTIETRNMNTN